MPRTADGSNLTAMVPNRGIPGRFINISNQFIFCFSPDNDSLRPLMLSTILRAASRPTLLTTSARLTSLRFASSHAQESFESFTERYVTFFQGAEDLFEVQRGLNNCFAHDLVPAPSVIEAALRASRRVNDYATAVRIFEGIKEKVENKSQYQAYLDELKPVREELGMFLRDMEWPFS